MRPPCSASPLLPVSTHSESRARLVYIIQVQPRLNKKRQAVRVSAVACVVDRIPPGLSHIRAAEGGAGQKHKNHPTDAGRPARSHTQSTGGLAAKAHVPENSGAWHAAGRTKSRILVFAPRRSSSRTQSALPWTQAVMRGDIVPCEGTRAAPTRQRFATSGSNRNKRREARALDTALRASTPPARASAPPQCPTPHRALPRDNRGGQALRRSGPEFRDPV